MHMGNAKAFEIFHTGGIILPCIFHRKGLIFPPVSLRHTAVPVIRKILNVKLIDDLLLLRFRSAVPLKPFRIREAQIHHHAPCPVAAAGSRIGIRRHGICAVNPDKIIIIRPMKTPLKGQLPDTLFPAYHLPLHAVCAFILPVKPQHDPLRRRAPHLECRPIFLTDCPEVLSVIPESLIQFYIGEFSVSHKPYPFKKGGHKDILRPPPLKLP